MIQRESVAYKRIAHRFRPQRIRPRPTNLDPKLANRTVIDQYGPKTSESDRDRRIWTQNLQIGPRSTNLDPTLANRTVVDQFGPKTSKPDRDRPIPIQTYQIGP